MFRMVFLAAMLLAAAAGGPYLLSNGSELLSSFTKPSGKDTPDEAAPGSPSTPGAGGAAIPGGNLPASVGQPVTDLAEVLRFDVSPGWVLGRWPHVATGMAHVQYQGYRVPLVSGTSEDDVAGSLTYYFNAQQQVERIVLRGTTGNGRKLIDLVTNRYQFVRRLTNDPGLFLFEAADSDGKVHSMLSLRPAHVLKADDRYRRYQVDLTLSRPG